MCRALRVLCAALTRDRLNALKHAAVSVHWELVGGATSIEDLLMHVGEFDPDVVIVEAGFGAEVVEAIRSLDDTIRIVAVGELPGSDEITPSFEHVREAVMGLPRPGGPVRF
jgi:hypothetical protein